MPGTLFSGEPLPLAPRVGDSEVAAFHRKLLDYLRRLGAKLEQALGPGGGGTGVVTTVKHVACYIDDDQDLAGTYTAINWTNTLWIDGDAFEHSAQYISVVNDGMYLILCDVELGDSGYSSADALMLISAPDGTEAFYPAFGYSTFGFGTNTMAVCVPLIAGRRFEIQIRCTLAPAAGQIKKQGTRLTVLRLRDMLDANEGEGWNDPTHIGIPLPWGIAQL
jgi:hypothetical protein